LPPTPPSSDKYVMLCSKSEIRLRSRARGGGGDKKLIRNFPLSPNSRDNGDNSHLMLLFSLESLRLGLGAAARTKLLSVVRGQGIPLQRQETKLSL